jgi:Photosynthesis system II assembly factor YCF48/Putative zinc-finger
MEQLPKIVRERLQATATAGAHPDPDLLAAFAEKSATPREQEEVLGHLATCVDCRDAVSLALPESQMDRVVAVAATPPQASPGRWHSSRVLRWGAAAACVAVVGAAVLLSRKNNSEVASVSTYVAPAGEAGKGEAAAPPASAENEGESRNEESKLARNVVPLRDQDTHRSIRLRTQEPAASAGTGEAFDEPVASNEIAAKVPGPPPVPLAAPVAQETARQQAELSKMVNNQPDKKEQVADKLQSAPAATSEMVTVEASAPVIETQTVAREKTKDSVAAKQDLDLKAGVAGGVVGGLGAASGNFGSKLRLPALRWMISPEGRLLESHNAGVGWAPVAVAEKTVLRALCVKGKDVWIGGAQGALYYSSDDGEHWEQVKPSADGRALTADIIAIEFSDPQHGNLTTASHETWTTADGGQSWQTK